MRFFKWFLVSLGALVLVAVLAGGGLLASAWMGQGEHRKFAQQFMFDFAESWNTGAIAERVTADTLEQLRSAEGRSIVARMSALGRLNSVSELKLVRMHTSGILTTVDFAFSAVYEGGKASGRIVVWHDSSAIKVKHFFVNSDGPLRGRANI